MKSDSKLFLKTSTIFYTMSVVDGILLSFFFKFLLICCLTAKRVKMFGLHKVYNNVIWKTREELGNNTNIIINITSKRICVYNILKCLIADKISENGNACHASKLWKGRKIVLKGGFHNIPTSSNFPTKL